MPKRNIVSDRLPKPSGHFAQATMVEAKGRLVFISGMLAKGPDGRMVGEIADALELPGATLSFHLKELSAAGLIEGEARGRYVCYRARFDAMSELIEFLTHNCCGGDASQCAPARPAAHTARDPACRGGPAGVPFGLTDGAAPRVAAARAGRGGVGLPR